MLSKATTSLFLNANKLLKFFGSENILYFSRNSIDHIIDNIYLGDYRCASNHSLLKQNEIKYIINCSKHVPCLFKDDFEYLELELEDNSKQEIGEAIQKALEFIKPDGNVFIHCKMGVSRSASIVLAYLMKNYLMDYDQAFYYTKEKREVILPNENFKEQLISYYTIICIQNDN